MKAEWQPAEIGQSPLPTPLNPPISSGFHLYAFSGAPACISGTFLRSRTGQSSLIIPILLSQFPPYYTSPSSQALFPVYFPVYKTCNYTSKHRIIEPQFPSFFLRVTVPRSSVQLLLTSQQVLHTSADLAISFPSVVVQCGPIYQLSVSTSACTGISTSLFRTQCSPTNSTPGATAPLCALNNFGPRHIGPKWAPLLNLIFCKDLRNYLQHLSPPRTCC